MIIWYATRTGRRLHLATIGARRTICNRSNFEPLCAASAGRPLDPRRICCDCRRVATALSAAALEAL